MFISNNRPSLHLRRKENLVKYRKVLKYYETDCSSYTKATILLDPKNWYVEFQQVLYLCRLPENVNQSKNSGGACLLIGLLTKNIFSKIILSPDFKILFSEKNRLE